MFWAPERGFVPSLIILAVVGFTGAAFGQAAVPAAATSRDADGRLIVHAIRLPEKLVLDGKLDEAIYTQVQPAGGFVQAEPNFGQPATEQTQLWVFYDDQAIYVGIKCFDSGMDQWSSLDMRRDGQNLTRGENIGLALDTFHDRRNGFLFGANPAGGMADSAVTNERDSNRDWNTIWETKTSKFDGGWSVEMAIPFKSLRYSAGDTQTWGINLRRTVAWKNETTFLTEVPLGGQGSVNSALFKFSSAATLVGIQAPPVSRLFEIKPYGISSMKTEQKGADLANKGSANVGLDVKTGVSESLVADFTYNTDFAQVEDDEQQVNLTRFSLFFPEKREFFLEGQGIFTFGGYAQRRNNNPGDMPLPFFSRRIGIDDEGHAIPMLGGGRMTGRVGKYSLGLLNIQTKEDADLHQVGTNFSVVRARRDILRRSNVGVIAINRSAYGERESANQTYGADGIFSFFQNVNINTFAQKTATPGRIGSDTAYRAQFEWVPDRYGISVEQTRVGKNFNPEVGYVRRFDFVRNFVDLRFSPRPAHNRFVRRYIYTGSFDRFERQSDGTLETRIAEATFGAELQNADVLNIQYLDDFEQLSINTPFFSSTAIIAPGRYPMRTLHADYELSAQHAVSGLVTYDQGGFYGGTKTSIGYSRGRVEAVHNLFVEPTLSLNWVDLPQKKFVANVISSRATYIFSPHALLSALLQFNSSNHALSTNARFRWEYGPGSDFFVVYNDGRDTRGAGYPDLTGRTLTVKLTRFFRR